MDTIVTPAAAEAQPPSILEAERLARADACIDACGNTETPYRIEITADGFVGYYGCMDCGQFWQTAWKDA